MNLFNSQSYFMDLEKSNILITEFFCKNKSFTLHDCIFLV